MMWMLVALVVPAGGAAAKPPPPTTTLTSAPSGTVASTTARFTFTASDAKASFSCKLDTANWSNCSSPKSYSSLAQGSHTFSVAAYDKSGTDSTPATATWKVDTVAPPAPSITGAPAATGNSSSATFQFSDAEAGVTWKCAIDGAAEGNCTDPVSFSGLADGSHTFLVRAIDAAGNVGAATTFAWTIDTTAPEAPTITSGPAANTTDTTATFAFTDSESGVAFLCTLDGAAPFACTSPASFSGLAPGAHSFSVSAADNAGNKSAAASVSWVVAEATNYLANGSFEGSLDGWSSYSGTLALASDGVDGANAAQVTLSAADTSFTIYPTNRPITTTSAGQPYTAGGWVRSDVPGKTVCIRIREFDSAGSQVGQTDSCVGTTTAWQRFPAVNYTTTVSGGQLTAFAILKNAVAKDSFEVDGLYLNDGTTSSAPPPPPPPPSTSNYLQNGSFEGTLAGWTTWNASLALAGDGVVGANAAKVSLTAADVSFSVFPATRPISSTVAGKPYTATGWVRSDTPGRSVCLRIREFDSSGTQVGQRDSCVTAGSTWKQFPADSYTTTKAGGQLTAFVLETGAQAGDSFEVDGLQLADGTDTTGTSSGWNSSDPLVVAAGDTACSPSDPDYNNGNGSGTRCMQKATASLIGSIPNVTALLPLGDNQYKCGDLKDFQTSYATTWGKFNAISHPIPGNHEYGDFASGCTASAATGYYQYFGALAGDPKKGYYSYDIGAWHLIALNSDCRAVGGCAAGSPEEMWLKNDLATHTNACTLAYWHIPLFSNGWVGDDPTDYSAWWQDLHNAHAELVLNGHDHTYQRFQPLDASGLPDTTAPTELIVGTGGEDLMSAPSKTSRMVIGDNKTFGVLKLQLHANGYDAQFLPIAGQTFSDSFSGTCQA
jgi:acid phosphatase type 7